jgi:hypothetical protein
VRHVALGALGALAFVTFGSLAACGPAGKPAASVHTDAALPDVRSHAFGPDDLHDIPLPAGARQQGAIGTTAEGGVSATYLLTDTNPDVALNDFLVQLVAVGWTSETPPTLQRAEWTASAVNGAATASLQALAYTPVPANGADAPQTSSYVTVTLTQT